MTLIKLPPGTDTQSYPTIATRHIEIDAAHRVPFHGSKCKNIHGHRYRVEMEIEGDLTSNGPSAGMVMDFGFMKDLLLRFVDTPGDHGLILWDADPLLSVLPGVHRADFTSPGGWTPATWEGGKLLLFPCIPTAENMARVYYDDIVGSIPSMTNGLARLKAITVHETPNCWARYAP